MVPGIPRVRGRTAPLSGWAGCLGGRRRLRKASRLFNELAQAVDGLLVGAEVVAVERLLGAPVLLGLLLDDARQRRRGRLRRARPLGATRWRGPGGTAEYLLDRVGQVGGVAELVVEEDRYPSQLRDRALACLYEDRLHVQQRVLDRHGQQVTEDHRGALLVEECELL